MYHWKYDINKVESIFQVAWTIIQKYLGYIRASDLAEKINTRKGEKQQARVLVVVVAILNDPLEFLVYTLKTPAATAAA